MARLSAAIIVVVDINVIVESEVKMKAERIEPKQEFIPVIVTLESQEEVDALFVVGNHASILQVLPGLNYLWTVLEPFTSGRKMGLYDDLNAIIN